MLLAIIDDKEKNIYTEIHFEEKSNKLYGFNIIDGVLLDLSNDSLNCLNLFKMSSNNKRIGMKDGYELYLDKDTGLVHFFKNGIPNYELLFAMNGKECTLCNETIPHYTGREGRFKKFVIKGITYICSAILFCGSITYSYPSLLFGERLTLKDGIVYLLGDDENKFETITQQDIKSYIYSSPNIESDEVKDFLWNEELIEAVLPYYEGQPLEFITKIRHHNLGVQPEKSKNHGGHYSFGNTIYVVDWSEENFNLEDFKAYAAAHEYVHLLQTDGFPFVIETEADIIAQEYYFHLAGNKGFANVSQYGYVEPCKYLKILMEIIGPEPIKDNAHRRNSTAIQDAIRPYLSDSEYDEFISILEISPGHYPKKLNDKLERFYELLSILYQNKYGEAIEENKMITAIKNDLFYDCFYFRESAIMSEQARCEIRNSLPIQEALDRGIVSLMKETNISMSDFENDSYPAKNKYLQIAVLGTPCVINIKDCKLQRVLARPDDTFSPGSHEELVGMTEHNDSITFIESEDGNTITIKIKKVLDVPKPCDYLELTVAKENYIVSLRLADGTEIPKEEYANYLGISFIATVPVETEEYLNNYKNYNMKYFEEGAIGQFKDGNFEYGEFIDIPPIAERFATDISKTISS